MDDGFRAVSSFPDPGALARARAFLLELGTPLPMDSWESLATICDTPWLANTRRPSRAAARVVYRRLRVLGGVPLALPAALTMRPGPVHLRGKCRPCPGAEEQTEIWNIKTPRDADQRRWLVEEGHDFVLTLPDGEAYILSEGGHLVSARELRAGDEVSVFGFVDEIPDRIGLARSSHGRGGLAVALRSGPELPMLVIPRDLVR